MDENLIQNKHDKILDNEAITSHYPLKDINDKGNTISAHNRRH